MNEKAHPIGPRQKNLTIATFEIGSLWEDETENRDLGRNVIVQHEPNQELLSQANQSRDGRATQ